MYEISSFLGYPWGVLWGAFDSEELGKLELTFSSACSHLWGMAAPNQIVLYNYGSNHSLVLQGNNDHFSQVRGGRRREKELKNWDFTVYRTLALGFICTILLYPLHKPSDYVLSLITSKEAEASRYSGIFTFHLGHLSSKKHWIIWCGWLNANPSPK